ncbi:MAG: cell division protein ZapA [Firmicutes bacterium]|nr:cell division protein ZapA [Bacillota bacterium]
MAEPIRVSVTIYGETYQLRTDLSEEVVQSLANEVDNRMRRAASKSANVSPTRLAVLALLNMAEDLARLHQEYDGLVQTMQKEWRNRKEMQSLK